MYCQSRLFFTAFLLCVTLCFSEEVTCEANEVEVTFFRQFMTFGGEEYVYVYETAVPDLILVSINTTNQKKHTKTAIRCLKMYTEHEILLKDTFGDGWTRGSYLNVTYDNTIVFDNLRLEKGSNATYHFTINSKVEPPPKNTPIWIWISLIGLIIVIVVVVGIILIKRHSNQSNKQLSLV